MKTVQGRNPQILSVRPNSRNMSSNWLWEHNRYTSFFTVIGRKLHSVAPNSELESWLWLRTCVMLRKSLRCVDSVLSSVKLRLWILLSHKRERIWVGSNEVDEPRTYYTRKSEREKQTWGKNAYIWNLDRWYHWTYLQGSNGDAGIKNRLVGTVREGEGGMNRESSIKTHTLPYVK